MKNNLIFVDGVKWVESNVLQVINWLNCVYIFWFKVFIIINKFLVVYMVIFYYLIDFIFEFYFQYIDLKYLKEFLYIIFLVLYFFFK